MCYLLELKKYFDDEGYKTDIVGDNEILYIFTKKYEISIDRLYPYGFWVWVNKYCKLDGVIVGKEKVVDTISATMEDAIKYVELYIKNKKRAKEVI